MLLKKTIRQLHLWVGLITGLVVLIVALTGCVYAFEEECRHRLHPELYQAAGRKLVDAMPILKAKELVEKTYTHKQVKLVIINPTHPSNLQFNLKTKEQIFVSPDATSIVGMLDVEHDLFGWALRLHRSLGLGDAGKWITGISALLFLFMLITGIVLWWPKHSRFKRSHFRIDSGTGKTRRLLDLHRIPGFYASFILIVMAGTGLVWSFKWFEKTMYALSFSRPEPKKEFHSVPKDAKSESPIDAIAWAVQKQYPTAKRIVLNFGEKETDALKVSVETGQKGLIRCYDGFVFDKFSGTLLQVTLHEQRSTGEKLKGSNYQFHTGKVLGLTGQWLVFLAGLVAASLPISGFILWRRKSKRKTYSVTALNAQ